MGEGAGLGEMSAKCVCVGGGAGVNRKTVGFLLFVVAVFGSCCRFVSFLFSSPFLVVKKWAGLEGV